VACHPETVGALGSNLLEEQVSWPSFLRLTEVVIIEDLHEAGEKFARQVQERMGHHAPTVDAVTPPDPLKDIGEMTTAGAHEFLTTSLAP
jgi:hypothetical protein